MDIAVGIYGLLAGVGTCLCHKEAVRPIYGWQDVIALLGFGKLNLVVVLQVKLLWL